ncbi:MAG: response regulator [Planctomycetes bacterium]|nr:response regulator [Planctomycetota bacterium]
MRALVIDDSRAMRSILGKIMGELRYEVVEAVNGRHGLERLREIGKPDLVLVDWNMPEMNGLDFIRAVRADRAFQDLVIMMVTTETEMAQVAKALEAGATEYLMKPFTKDTIIEKLALLGVAPA